MPMINFGTKHFLLCFCTAALILFMLPGAKLYCSSLPDWILTSEVIFNTFFLNDGNVADSQSLDFDGADNLNDECSQTAYRIFEFYRDDFLFEKQDVGQNLPYLSEALSYYGVKEIDGSQLMPKTEDLRQKLRKEKFNTVCKAEALLNGSLFMTVDQIMQDPALVFLLEKDSSYEIWKEKISSAVSGKKDYGKYAWNLYEIQTLADEITLILGRFGIPAAVAVPPSAGKMLSLFKEDGFYLFCLTQQEANYLNSCLTFVNDFFAFYGESMEELLRKEVSDE